MLPSTAPRAKTYPPDIPLMRLAATVSRHILTGLRACETARTALDRLTTDRCRGHLGPCGPRRNRKINGGVYRWMVHTCFFDSEVTAAAAFDELMPRIEAVCELIAAKGDRATFEKPDGVMSMDAKIGTAVRSLVDDYRPSFGRAESGNRVGGRRRLLQASPACRGWSRR